MSADTKACFWRTESDGRQLLTDGHMVALFETRYGPYPWPLTPATAEETARYHADNAAFSRGESPSMAWMVRTAEAGQ